MERERWEREVAEHCFGIEKPQAAVVQVVSVTDDIRLELAFSGTQSD